jgi:hypothetical protein
MVARRSQVLMAEAWGLHFRGLCQDLGLLLGGELGLAMGAEQEVHGAQGEVLVRTAWASQLIC